MLLKYVRLQYEDFRSFLTIFSLLTFLPELNSSVQYQFLTICQVSTKGVENFSSARHSSKISLYLIIEILVLFSGQCRELVAPLCLNEIRLISYGTSDQRNDSGFRRLKSKFSSRPVSSVSLKQLKKQEQKGLPIGRLNTPTRFLEQERFDF